VEAALISAALAVVRLVVAADRGGEQPHHVVAHGTVAAQKQEKYAVPFLFFLGNGKLPLPYGCSCDSPLPTGWPYNSARSVLPMR
jgi:hypothetical protein